MAKKSFFKRVASGLRALLKNPSIKKQSTSIPKRSSSSTSIPKRSSSSKSSSSAKKAKTPRINIIFKSIKQQINKRKQINIGNKQRAFKSGNKKEYNQTQSDKYKDYSVVRRNEIFKQQVKASSKGTPIGDIGETETRAFFRATQTAWEGKSAKERYSAIQEYYATDDLMQLYDAIIEQNKSSIDIIKKVENGEELTKEQKEAYLNMLQSDDEQEKRYRENDKNSPLRGNIAPNIKPFTKQQLADYIETLATNG